MRNIGPGGTPESVGPFDITGGWAKFALGYGVLWFSLIFMVEAGAGEFASALAVVIAGGMVVVAGDAVTKNLGLGG